MVAKGKQGSRKDWKLSYFDKLRALLKEYPKAFIVKVDNVGSSQMQQIRHSLRGHAVIIMGKNTMMRKTITDMREQHPDLEKLLPHVRGNVGFVLTKDDLSETRDKILGNRVAAPAKAGAIAPCDVKIPAQNTGLPPEKTSFFQALSIPTKINRGTIEILTDVSLIREGQKVGASEATLLGMLKIMPFTYGLVIDQVYDSGAVFEPAVLDITQEHLLERISEGVANVASVALAIGQPTLVSVTHSFLDGFRNLVALSLETDYSFPAADKMKEAIASGAAKAAAAPPAAAAKADAKSGGGKQEKAKEEPKKPEPKKEEPKPAEEEDDMGLSLFD